MSYRRSPVALGLMAIATIVGVASVNAQGERTGMRREAAARSSHRAYGVPREQEPRAMPHREASYVRQRPMVGAMSGGRLAAGDPVHVASRAAVSSQFRVTRYGNGLSGTVERSVRPGLMSR